MFKKIMINIIVVGALVIFVFWLGTSGYSREIVVDEEIYKVEFKKFSPLGFNRWIKVTVEFDNGNKVASYLDYHSDGVDSVGLQNKGRGGDMWWWDDKEILKKGQERFDFWMGELKKREDKGALDAAREALDVKMEREARDRRSVSQVLKNLP